MKSADAMVQIKDIYENVSHARGTPNQCALYLVRGRRVFGHAWGWHGSLTQRDTQTLAIYEQNGWEEYPGWRGRSAAEQNSTYQPTDRPQQNTSTSQPVTAAGEQQTVALHICHKPLPFRTIRKTTEIAGRL